MMSLVEKMLGKTSGEVGMVEWRGGEFGCMLKRLGIWSVQAVRRRFPCFWFTILYSLYSSIVQIVVVA